MGHDGNPVGGGGALGKTSLAGPGGGMGVGSMILNKAIPQNPSVACDTLFGLYLAGGGVSAASPSASASVGPVGGYGSDPGPAMVNTGMGTPGATGTNSAAAGSGVVFLRYRFQ